jgi:hypothetical protein
MATEKTTALPTAEPLPVFLHLRHATPTHNTATGHLHNGTPSHNTGTGHLHNGTQADNTATTNLE